MSTVTVINKDQHTERVLIECSRREADALFGLFSNADLRDLAKVFDVLESEYLRLNDEFFRALRRGLPFGCDVQFRENPKFLTVPE